MLAFIAASLFVAAANAHMVMSNPVPYASPQVINSPLNADGSNFPCQLSAGQSLVSGSASNTFALGSEQKLAFIGQAVHGGGSCQVSITYDKNPSASSTWKVIQSIVGGCPAQNQAGNMGSNAAAVDPYTYNFTLPDDIPTGDVTLAWTWFNKIGNREMYMNCAPVTLTGTSGSSANYDSLPDMFVANIGNGCSTAQTADLVFPDPGAAVVSLNGATTTFASPIGSCQVATAAPTQATSAAGTATTSPAAVSTAKTTPAAYSGGGVFLTVATGAAATSSPAAAATTAAAETTAAPAVAVTAATTAATSAAAAATTATTAATAAATGSASSGSSSSSSSSGSTGTLETAGAACSPDGTWNCMGSSYQQCASGVWSVAMKMAAGTACTGGKSASFNIVASSSKHRRNAARMAARMAPRIPRRK